jgi:hypothetical protein
LRILTQPHPSEAISRLGQDLKEQIDGQAGHRSARHIDPRIHWSLELIGRVSARPITQEVPESFIAHLARAIAPRSVLQYGAHEGDHVMRKTPQGIRRSRCVELNDIDVQIRGHTESTEAPEHGHTLRGRDDQCAGEGRRRIPEDPWLSCDAKDV